MKHIPTLTHKNEIKIEDILLLEDDNTKIVVVVEDIVAENEEWEEHQSVLRCKLLDETFNPYNYGPTVTVGSNEISSSSTTTDVNFFGNDKWIVYKIGDRASYPEYFL